MIFYQYGKSDKKILLVHGWSGRGQEMDNYTSYKSAFGITIPVLVIHDKNDPEVPVTAGINFYKHLKNEELLRTQGLGHRKILGNHSVIEKIVGFI